MDCQRIKELLQSVAILAVRAQDAIDNGNNDRCWENCEMMMVDIENTLKEMEKVG